jgi:Ca2+:H+ antiporter
MPQTASVLRSWPVLVPALAVVALVLTWGRDLGPAALVAAAALLAGAVLAAVHHAEVVALRVGEPYGSLILAVAVTVIEVALIVTIMISAKEEASALACDTVFAAVMITINGIVGITLLIATLRRRVAVFNAEGTGGALATVAALATMTLVLPDVHHEHTRPDVLVGSAGLRGGGVVRPLRPVRLRPDSPPPRLLPSGHGRGQAGHSDEHVPPPETRVAVASLMLLLIALIGVVGLAKTVSPTVEEAVRTAGLPLAVVGVVIALLVLLPETLAAVRAALRDRIQTSFNLALGSAMASIGLTIPTIAVASIWLDPLLLLGLGATQTVLLALTVVVGVLTVTPGRATLLQAGVHLALFAGFLVLAVSP